MIGQKEFNYYFFFFFGENSVVRVKSMAISNYFRFWFLIVYKINIPLFTISSSYYHSTGSLEYLRIAVFK